MAKRRKTPEEEEKEIFEEPEFDERSYLLMEMRKAKGIIIVFLLSLFIGFISGYIHVYVSVYLAAIIGFVVLVLLKPILIKLKAEFSDRKTWFYAFALFLLIWFTGWTISLNPPFNDVSPPQIRSVEVYNGTAWVEIYEHSTGVNQKHINSIQWSSSMNIRVFASDNVGIDEVKINGQKADINNGYYEVNGINPHGKITVQAWDVNGYSSSISITVPTGT